MTETDMDDKDQILITPLNQVKRQFKQNCAFVFSGAVFLATPQLVSTIQAHILSNQAESAIFFDGQDLPVRIEPRMLISFLRSAEEQLRCATDTFIEQYKVAHEQFERLLDVPALPDEETE